MRRLLTLVFLAAVAVPAAAQEPKPPRQPKPQRDTAVRRSYRFEVGPEGATYSIFRRGRLGVVVDIQPAWLYLDTRTLTKQFGYDRLRYFQPLKSIFAAGGVAGGGSDHMQKIGSFRSINPYNPFLGIWTTLVRQPRWTDVPLHPEEKITREQAIRFYTINNAWLTFEEKEKGSLEPGKLADFIVIDRNLLTCDVDAIRETTVEQTWLGGRRVYERPANDSNSNR